MFFLFNKRETIQSKTISKLFKIELFCQNVVDQLEIKAALKALRGILKAHLNYQLKL